MLHRSFSSMFWMILVIVCESMVGCGQFHGPLVMNKNNKIVGPWCAPNQRVQIGQRVVGQVPDGNKWKDFFVDDQGQEHDPDRLADQVWSYLERTGDAAGIKDEDRIRGHITRMFTVSIRPLVVILQKSPEYREPIALPAGNDRWYWVSHVSAMYYPPPFQEELMWFSPDLKQRPTNLIFSNVGIAEIPIPNGSIELTREGDHCNTTRR